MVAVPAVRLGISFEGVFGVILAAALVVLVFQARLFALACRTASSGSRSGCGTQGCCPPIFIQQLSRSAGNSASLATSANNLCDVSSRFWPEDRGQHPCVPQPLLEPDDAVLHRKRKQPRLEDQDHEAAAKITPKTPSKEIPSSTAGTATIEN